MKTVEAEYVADLDRRERQFLNTRWHEEYGPRFAAIRPHNSNVAVIAAAMLVGAVVGAAISAPLVSFLSAQF